ncbi:MAG: hypothetical protein JJ974_10255 [Phycisphaerales bacterium]|nr:hypothetical protein [Phycisphaerales bacterium]
MPVRMQLSALGKQQGVIPVRSGMQQEICRTDATRMLVMGEFKREINIMINIMPECDPIVLGTSIAK